MDEAWILLLSGHLASWIQTPPECLSFHFPRAKGNNHDDRKYIRKEARPFDGLKMRALSKGKSPWVKFSGEPSQDDGQDSR